MSKPKKETYTIIMHVDGKEIMENVDVNRYATFKSLYGQVIFPKLPKNKPTKAEDKYYCELNGIAIATKSAKKLVKDDVIIVRKGKSTLSGLSREKQSAMRDLPGIIKVRVFTGEEKYIEHEVALGRFPTFNNLYRVYIHQMLPERNNNHQYRYYFTLNGNAISTHDTTTKFKNNDLIEAKAEGYFLDETSGLTLRKIPSRFTKVVPVMQNYIVVKAREGYANMQILDKLKCVDYYGISEREISMLHERIAENKRFDVNDESLLLYHVCEWDQALCDKFKIVNPLIASIPVEFGCFMLSHYFTAYGVSPGNQSRYDNNEAVNYINNHKDFVPKLFKHIQHIFDTQAPIKIAYMFKNGD